jgi:hypothetical protein
LNISSHVHLMLSFSGWSVWMCNRTSHLSVWHRALYLGHPGLRYLPEEWLSWLKLFVVHPDKCCSLPFTAILPFDAT